jgi:hypothetical protein
MFGIPPGPPRPGGGPPPLVNSQGYVHTYVPGMGYRQATQFGIPVRDTSPGGFPRMAPTIGPRQPERMIGGLPITGPGGEPLFRRAPR